MTPNQASYLRRAAALSGHGLHPGDVVTLVRYYLAAPMLVDTTPTTLAMLAKQAEENVDKASEAWFSKTGIKVA